MKSVVGTLLNFRGAWQALEPRMHKEPHHKPPVHPVLYIKPVNTWRGPGDAIVLPPDVPEVEAGATVGIVMGRAASRLNVRNALAHVAGYAIVNDVTVPHEALLRPPMRQKCRDSFCPIGAVVPASRIADPDALTLRTYVNGELRQTNTTANLMRNTATLLADVTEFMSFEPGDILLVGVPENSPRAKPGDTIRIEVDGLGSLQNPVVQEGVSS
ncbi:fumarylacetoacetate hydrolase family protein [Ramlibacter sp.]|uniref:fumarylacetoacetate hydrolase family protein n=1 Tax=Ramlibacter sp. TaxID=1917967 RepID=UPI003D0F8020